MATRSYRIPVLDEGGETLVGDFVPAEQKLCGEQKLYDGSTIVLYRIIANGRWVVCTHPAEDDSATSKEKKIAKWQPEREIAWAMSDAEAAEWLARRNLPLHEDLDLEQLRREDDIGRLPPMSAHGAPPKAAVSDTPSSPKVRIASSDASVLILCALREHHELDDGGGAGNWQPIGVRALEKKLQGKVGRSAISEWFKANFSDHVEYKACCRRKEIDINLRELAQELPSRFSSDSLG